MNRFALCAFSFTTIVGAKAMAETPRMIQASQEVVESGINSWLVEQHDRVSRVVGVDADGVPQIEMLVNFAASNSAGNIELRTYRPSLAWASFELDALSPDTPPSPQGNIGALDAELVKALQADLQRVFAASPVFLTSLKCQIDFNNIAISCGGFILNAIVCGQAPSMVGCAPIPLTMLACRTSVLQGCLDACINPGSLWCQ